MPITPITDIHTHQSGVFIWSVASEPLESDTGCTSGRITNLLRVDGSDMLQQQMQGACSYGDNHTGGSFSPMTSCSFVSCPRKILVFALFSHERWSHPFKIHRLHIYFFILSIILKVFQTLFSQNLPRLSAKTTYSDHIGG